MAIDPDNPLSAIGAFSDTAAREKEALNTQKTRQTLQSLLTRGKQERESTLANTQLADRLARVTNREKALWTHGFDPYAPDTLDRLRKKGDIGMAGGAAKAAYELAHGGYTPKPLGFGVHGKPLYAPVSINTILDQDFIPGGELPGELAAIAAKTESKEDIGKITIDQVKGPDNKLVGTTIKEKIEKTQKTGEKIKGKISQTSAQDEKLNAMLTQLYLDHGLKSAPTHIDRTQEQSHGIITFTFSTETGKRTFRMRTEISG